MPPNFRISQPNGFAPSTRTTKIRGEPVGCFSARRRRVSAAACRACGERNRFFGSSDISDADELRWWHAQSDANGIFKHSNQSHITPAHHSHTPDETRNLRPTGIGSRFQLQFCAMSRHGQMCAGLVNAVNLMRFSLMCGINAALPGASIAGSRKSLQTR